jgi:hypothetical protein
VTSAVNLPPVSQHRWSTMTTISGCLIGSSDFDIFLEIQYASCVFGLALKSSD